MLGHLLAALNTVLPMFLVVGLGFLAKQRGWVTPPALRQFNLLGFRLFLPCYLFRAIYESEWGERVDTRLALATVTALLVVLALAFAAVLAVEKRRNYRGVMIQSIYQSNFIVMGLPLITAVFGNADASYVPLVIAIVIPMFNVLAVVVLEIFRGEKSGFRGTLVQIFKNPLVVGALAALACKLLRVPLDRFPPLMSAVSALAQASTPLLLFILGASFDFASLRGDRFQITFTAVARLVAAPLAALAVGRAFALPAEQLAVLMSAFISPTGSAVFPMAQQMGGNERLAAGTILFTTACSFVTMSLWIAFLRSLVLG
ncbi:MAG: AEC family transporter [Oscillibacter sp.]|nr:AEC family transporter [Oscillibacter sp.]